MSGIENKDLVQVRSHDELRAGMTLVMKQCPRHRKSCAMVILRKFPDGGPHRSSKAPWWTEPCPWPWAVSTTHGAAIGTCFCHPIRDGRLFRLRDLDDGETDSEATERPKSLVRT